MNGRNILLDTNVVLFVLSDLNHLVVLKGCNLYISFITELELLSYPAISEKDKITIQKFISKTTIIDINTIIKENTIELRKKYKIKLPDAIISATALANNFVLYTNDKGLLKITEIKIKSCNYLPPIIFLQITKIDRY